MPILHEKILENDDFLWFSSISSFKIGKKSKVDNIFEKNAPDFLPLCVEAMFQISARLDFKCKSS